MTEGAPPVAAHGEIAWTELNTWEPAKAAAFFQDVLGWSIDEMPTPGDPDGVYRVARVGDRMICGIFELKSPEMDGVPSSWLTYVEVDDVDVAAAKTTANGGVVINGPFDVPSVGRIVVIKDPTGGVVGFMRSEPPAGA